MTFPGASEKKLNDSISKRVSANYFYKIYNFFASPPIPENVGDFRLMDKIVVEAICQIPDRCRFMKGIFAWAGFKTHTIEYERPLCAKG